MDRDTARKMMTEFTADIDLTSPSGVISADKIDKYIMQALKPLLEEGKAFRRAKVNQSTGVRSVSYAYQGGAGIRNSIDAIIKDLHADLGFEGPDSAPFRISEQQRKYYTQTQERILDPRTAAAIKAQAVRAGGMAQTDRSSGITTTFVPTRAASGLHAAVDSGDARYLAGASLSAPGLSGGANIHEQAYAAVARQERQFQARKNAAQNFIKANPNSELARRSAMVRKKGNARARNLAKGAMGTAVGALVGLTATAVVALHKILGGVLETAKNTTKMMSDSARFNLSGTAMSQFKGMARGMGYADGDDPFAAIMGVIASKVTNPGSSGFAGAISGAAPFLQGDTTKLLQFITGNASSPDKIMYEVLASTMNATMAGRGGVIKGLAPDKAMVANVAALNDILGSQGGDMFSRLFARMKTDDTLKQDHPFTGKEIQSLMEGMFLGIGGSAGTANAVVPSSLSLEAAKKGSQALTEISNIWAGMGDTIFTKMLGYLGEIAQILRTALRPYIAAIDPGWEARENAGAVKENFKQTAAAEADLKRYSPDSIEYKFAQKRLEDLKAGRTRDIGAIGVPTLKGRTVMPMGMSPEENASRIADMYYQEWLDKTQATQEQLNNSWYDPTFHPTDSMQRETMLSTNKGIGKIFGNDMAIYEGNTTDKKTLGAIALFRKLMAADPTAPLHSFADDFKAAGFEAKDLAGIESSMRMSLKWAPANTKLAKQVALDDMMRMQLLMKTGNLDSSPEAGAAAFAEGSTRGENYLLNTRAYEAMKRKFGASYADNMFEMIGSNKATESVKGIANNTATIEIVFDKDGKKQTISLDVNANGISANKTGIIAGAGYNAKVVAGAKSTTK